MAASANRLMKVLFFCITTGNRRCHHIGRIGADHEIDFVDIQKLGVDARYVRRVGLIVVIDELDLAAEQSALGINVFRPDLGADQCHLAVRRKRAGERHAGADLDRLGVLRSGGKLGCDKTGRKDQGAGCAGNGAARSVTYHVVSSQRRLFDLPYPDRPPVCRACAAVSAAQCPGLTRVERERRAAWQSAQGRLPMLKTFRDHCLTFQRRFAALSVTAAHTRTTGRVPIRTQSLVGE